MTLEEKMTDAIKREDFDQIEEMIIQAPMLLEGDHYPEGRSPLHIAAMTGTAEFVKKMIEARDNYDMKCHINRDGQRNTCLLKGDHAGNTPFHLAVLSGNDQTFPVLRYGLEKPLNTPNRSGNTPLHLAVIAKRQSTVEKLLDLGGTFWQCSTVEICRFVDPTIVNDDGYTPASLARTLGENEIAELIEEREIEWRIRNLGEPTNQPPVVESYAFQNPEHAVRLAEIYKYQTANIAIMAWLGSDCSDQILIDVVNTKPEIADSVVEIAIRCCESGYWKVSENKKDEIGRTLAIAIPQQTDSIVNKMAAMANDRKRLTGIINLIKAFPPHAESLLSSVVGKMRKPGESGGGHFGLSLILQAEVARALPKQFNLIKPAPKTKTV